MSYTILLVDDDADFREEFADALYEYRIIDAPDGETAIKMLKQPNDIDLVILDVIMPGIKGIDALKIIKTYNKNIGVIMLTGHSSKDIAIQALRADADDYIEKPCDIEKTKTIIKRVLVNKQAPGCTDDDSPKGKIQRLKELAEKNWDKKLSLNDAASMVCLNAKYLSRIFKEHTGIGFSEYKLKIKTKKACELLKTTSLNIEQISRKLGYENPESFIKIFKKYIKTTPKSYRDNG